MPISPPALAPARSAPGPRSSRGPWKAATPWRRGRRSSPRNSASAPCRGRRIGRASASSRGASSSGRIGPSACTTAWSICGRARVWSDRRGSIRDGGAPLPMSEAAAGKIDVGTADAPGHLCLGRRRRRAHRRQALRLSHDQFRQPAVDAARFPARRRRLAGQSGGGAHGPGAGGCRAPLRPWQGRAAGRPRPERLHRGLGPVPAGGGGKSRGQSLADPEQRDRPRGHGVLDRRHRPAGSLSAPRHPGDQLRRHPGGFDPLCQRPAGERRGHCRTSPVARSSAGRSPIRSLPPASASISCTRPGRSPGAPSIC